MSVVYSCMHTVRRLTYICGACCSGRGPRGRPGRLSGTGSRSTPPSTLSAGASAAWPARVRACGRLASRQHRPCHPTAACEVGRRIAGVASPGVWPSAMGRAELLAARLAAQHAVRRRPHAQPLRHEGGRGRFSASGEVAPRGCMEHGAMVYWLQSNQICWCIHRCSGAPRAATVVRRALSRSRLRFRGLGQFIASGDAGTVVVLLDVSFGKPLAVARNPAMQWLHRSWVHGTAAMGCVEENPRRGGNCGLAEEQMWRLGVLYRQPLLPTPPSNVGFAGCDVRAQAMVRSDSPCLGCCVDRPCGQLLLIVREAVA